MLTSAAQWSACCVRSATDSAFSRISLRGPATAASFAARTGIGERYAREWLSALASAGYLDYDPSSGRFNLPFEHAPALAQEGGPMFLGGGYQQLQGLMVPFDDLLRAFRDGGGVAQEAYGEHLRVGMERMSATWFDNLLVSQWIPLIPDVQAALTRGVRAADVGCGSGRALIRLAEAFPDSRFDGFDASGPVVARAVANAEGLAGRVRFERRNAARGAPGALYSRHAL